MIKGLLSGYSNNDLLLLLSFNKPHIYEDIFHQANAKLV